MRIIGAIKLNWQKVCLVHHLPWEQDISWVRIPLARPISFIGRSLVYRCAGFSGKVN